LLASDQVVPDDRLVVVELEPPMRRSAFRRWLLGGVALVDRRQSASEEHLAAKIELLRGFVTGIDPSRRLQTLKLAFVQLEALRLTDDLVGAEPEPVEIVTDRMVELGRRALAVGVVDPEGERAAVLPRE